MPKTFRFTITIDTKAVVQDDEVEAFKELRQDLTDNPQEYPAPMVSIAKATADKDLDAFMADLIRFNYRLGVKLTDFGKGHTLSPAKVTRLDTPPAPCSCVHGYACPACQ